MKHSNCPIMLNRGMHEKLWTRTSNPERKTVMFRNWKWARLGLTALLAAGLLSGGFVWAKKPPKDPPPPPPPPVTYTLTWLDTFDYSTVFDQTQFLKTC